MAKALRDAISAIGDTIVDLSELKVQTVIGDVKAVIDKQQLEDLGALLKPAGGDASSTARLQLVLDTTIKFDGDSINFIDTGKATPELLDLHNGAVMAGLQQRQAIVEMFKGLIR